MLQQHKLFIRFLMTTVVAFLFVAPAVHAGDGGISAYDSLSARLSDAEKSGDYDAALEIAKKLEETVWPLHVDVMYNMARIHSLRGERSRAYEYLFWATDSGFWDVGRMRDDPAFASIRDEALFKKLSRKAWLNGYLFMLEREEREDYQEKDRIIGSLDLKPGDVVADVGAGSGYFTIPIAKKLGGTGRVIATDIRQQMLDYIARRLEIEQLDNVELLLGLPDDPKLPAGEVDLILMVDVYHYIKDRAAFGRKLREALAPGGRLVVIDFIPKPWEERPWGPPPEQHLSKETLNADLAKAGLRVIREYDFISEEYFVVYGAD